MGRKDAVDPSRLRLQSYGLEPGEPVRFLPRPGGRWRQGTALGAAADGSVQVLDERGRLRMVLPVRMQMWATGPRGGKSWKALRRSS